LRKPSGGILCILIVSSFLAACGYKTNPRPATATIPGEITWTDARAYSDRVALRWQLPLANVDGSRLTDISGFKVYRAEQKTGEECENCEEKKTMHANVDYQNPTNAVIANGEVTYTDKDVTPGNTYFYSVSAYNLRGRDGKLSENMTVQLDEPPPAPEGLRAMTEAGAVTLEWTSGTQGSGIKGYRVYRGTTSNTGEMKPVGETKVPETSFVDKDVEKEKNYYYVVRSFKMNRVVPYESVASPIARVTVSSTTQHPPENVRTDVKRDGIRIYWDEAKSPNEKIRYNVYRQEAGRAYQKINSEPLRTSWFFDRQVLKGKTYRYTVASFQEGKPEDESSRTASPAVEYKP
jgi:fibronectin type 3 domain-containing protein